MMYFNHRNRQLITKKYMKNEYKNIDIKHTYGKLQR